jgi:hypothetical protein
MITYNRDPLSNGFISAEYEATNQTDVNEDGDNGINVSSKARSLKLDFGDDGSTSIKSSNNLIASCVNIGPGDCVDIGLKGNHSVLEILATPCERGKVCSENVILQPPHAYRMRCEPQCCRLSPRERQGR